MTGDSSDVTRDAGPVSAGACRRSPLASYPVLGRGREADRRPPQTRTAPHLVVDPQGVAQVLHGPRTMPRSGDRGNGLAACPWNGTLVHERLPSGVDMRRYA